MTTRTTTWSQSTSTIGTNGNFLIFLTPLSLATAPFRLTPASVPGFSRIAGSADSSGRWDGEPGSVGISLPFPGVGSHGSIRSGHINADMNTAG